MTRTTLLLAAALACFTVSCERHPASELAGEHGEPGAEGGKGVAPHAEAASAAVPEATAPAPGDTPKNPSGSAPVSPERKGAQYFPDAK